MPEELVDIVNENDEVVGVATREEAHEKMLLHRLVDVWFYNLHGQVLLQRRSKLKKSLPGLLDYTVGGHVSSGETYEEGLLKEVREETGVTSPLDRFILVKTFMPHADGNVDDLRLHARKAYLYLFEGDIQSLSFDLNEVESFEWWDIDILIETLKMQPEMFSPFLSHRVNFEILGIAKTYSMRQKK